MTTETDGGAQPNAEDTAAVLAHASGGDKTYVSEPKAEEPKDEDTSGDDAPAGTGATEVKAEGEQPEAKAKKPTAQERIDALTRARHDAEREVARLRQQLADKPKADTAAGDDAEPDPTQYEAGEFDPKYLKAVAAHAGRQAAREAAAEVRQVQAQRSVDEDYNARLRAAAEKHGDFDEVVMNNKWVCTPEMFETIKESDQGPEVAYHLAKNPAEAQRIAALSPLAQAREIGRLEAQLSTPAAPQAKTATDAPDPAPTVRGAGGRFKVAADTQDFAAFEKQYLGG